MPSPELQTFADFADLLSLHSGSGAIATNQGQIRAAVMVAYDNLVKGHNWSYFQQHGRIITSAPVESTTATVTYTNSTRAALHSATNWSTLASWVLSGRLRLGDVVHSIDSVSTTTATLNAVLNPGADIAASTDWTLYRNIYSLPADFLAMSDIVDENGFHGARLSYEEFMSLERSANVSSSNPWFYAIIGDPDNYGGKALAIYPYPDSVMTFDYIYQRLPRQLLITGLGTAHTAGTISNSGTAVTGTSTSFNSNMVGSVLRFGTTSALPDGLFGINPYVEQRTITAVSGTTGLTLNSAPSSTYSGVLYRISDPVDLHPAMLDAFLRGCERELSIIVGSRNTAQAHGLWKEARLRAAESDKDYLPSGGPRSFDENQIGTALSANTG